MSSDQCHWSGTGKSFPDGETKRLVKKLPLLTHVKELFLTSCIQTFRSGKNSSSKLQNISNLLHEVPYDIIGTYTVKVTCKTSIIQFCFCYLVL